MAHIDTLKAYKQYLEAGYTEDQAVTAVQALNSSFDTVATKEDIRALEKDLHKEINRLEKDLHKEIQRSEKDLHKEIKGLETSIDAKFSTIDAKFNIIEKVGGSFCISMMILLIKIAFWP